MLAIIQHGLGNKPESDAALRQLIASHGDHYAFQIAEVHAVQGDTDTAFEWLNRAYTQHDFGLSELQGTASFRSHHGDPRWRAMLAKMGFEDATTS
jgi:hypothetical protein